MRRNKQIESTDWLTKGVSKEKLEREYQEVIAEIARQNGYRKASEVAREVFEEIEKIFGVHLWLNSTPWEYQKYEELKKKYIGEDINVTTNTEGEG